MGERDPKRIKAADRPVYHLQVRAEPGVDEVRALRFLLKSMLRRFGLRCVAIEPTFPVKP